MRATISDIKGRALAFSKRWADARDEAAEAKTFWIDFLAIFGISNHRLPQFEHHVRLLGKRRGYIDLFWPGMLLVEHKSLGKDLNEAMNQAMDYLQGVSEDEMPELVVVCDFARFVGLNLKTGEQLEFETCNLHKHIMWFGHLAGIKPLRLSPEAPVNIKAAERMGRLHDALKASGYQGHQLEVLLVRLLFCLFADDTNIFEPTQIFRDYVREHTRPDGSDLGPRLAQLFQVLDTPNSERGTNLDDTLDQFPYINGSLFAESIRMANFDAPMHKALMKACELDWSQISPAIFGSLFQSIMDADARRNLGAHYTSEANILKVLGPLFLDELKAEFERAQKSSTRLQALHQRLQDITLFDPACGCGNFLVIGYRELRALELKVLSALNPMAEHRGQRILDVQEMIKVNVNQCHGIEIEEFPAQIAQVALWLVDHQMNLKVSEEFGQTYARIPLKRSPHVVHGNALSLDWASVLPPQQCSYVVGNPPFLGYSYQSKQQKEDLSNVMRGIKGAGVLDFVCGWYIKAAHYVRKAVQEQGPAPRCAFVSTNSITQGEQVPVLWAEMHKLGLEIGFAHRTFQWSNEASGKAAVHCVIVGFGWPDGRPKQIYEYEDIKGPPHPVAAKNINAYLMDGPTVFIERRVSPFQTVPAMVRGSSPVDGGNLLLSDEEKKQLLEVEPQAEAWIRPYLMGDEFINNIPRWCLWLVNCSPKQLRALPEVLKRVEGVSRMRKASTKAATVALAQTPAVFGEIRTPNGNKYLAIPMVSSERRQYIPIGYLSGEVICGNKIFFINDASLYTFGILTSTMHNAWMRTTCGRLKSDYNYSNTLVYNNFPWPDAVGEAISDKHRSAIEEAAQAVLDARALFPDSSLADLYDPVTMPPALLKAHQKLDNAVDKAYEANGGKRSWANDAERVAFLFDLYQRTTSLLPSDKTRTKRKPKEKHTSKNERQT